MPYVSKNRSKKKRGIDQKWLNIGLAALILLVIGAGFYALLPRPPVIDAAAIAESDRQAAERKAKREAEALAAEEAKVYAAFLGDSFTAGTGAADAEDDRWTALLSEDRGWIEKNYGSGGTNYATGSEQTGGKAYTVRVPDVIKADPDIVIVSGGGNSLGMDQSEGITEVFTELRAGLPDAKIYGLSPFWRAEPFPDRLTVVAEQIREGVEAVDGTYVELSHPLEDRPEFMAKDKAHPNTEGYAFLAKTIDAELP